MAHTAEVDANTARLFEILKPFILQLLRDCPPFGEISLAATLHDGDISRVRIGAEVSRVVSPRADRGKR